MTTQVARNSAVTIDRKKYEEVYKIWQGTLNIGDYLNSKVTQAILAEAGLSGSLEADVAEWMEDYFGGLICPYNIGEVELFDGDMYEHVKENINAPCWIKRSIDIYNLIDRMSDDMEISQVAGSLWCMNPANVRDLIETI